MKVKIIMQTSRFTKFRALEGGSILTSSGDHPGPDDIWITIKQGEAFTLYPHYIIMNNLEIQSSSRSTAK